MVFIEPRSLFWSFDFGVGVRPRPISQFTDPTTSPVRNILNERRSYFFSFPLPRSHPPSDSPLNFPGLFPHGGSPPPPPTPHRMGGGGGGGGKRRRGQNGLREKGREESAVQVF